MGVLTLLFPFPFSCLENMFETRRGCWEFLNLLLRLSAFFLNLGDGFGRRGCDAGRGFIGREVGGRGR